MRGGKKLKRILELVAMYLLLQIGVAAAAIDWWLIFGPNDIVRAAAYTATAFLLMTFGALIVKHIEGEDK